VHAKALKEEKSHKEGEYLTAYRYGPGRARRPSTTTRRKGPAEPEFRGPWAWGHPSRTPIDFSTEKIDGTL
jgi:hypothetical protein